MQIRHGATVAVAAALALTGCGGGDGGSTVTSSTPTPTGPGSSSSSSSPKSTASPATATSTGPPAEAKADTKGGAEAFAVWYWKQLGEQTHTGDGSVSRASSLPTCKVCQDLADKHDQRGKQDMLSKKNPYAVTLKSSREEGAERFVTLRVSFKDYEMVDRSGKVKATVRGDRFDVVATLRRHTETWKIADWYLVK